MKINQTKLVKVEANAKTLNVRAYCGDMFSYIICDQDSKEIFAQEDGYVPDFMPGEHYGERIILDIDIDTGVIKNWVSPKQEEIEGLINQPPKE